MALDNKRERRKEVIMVKSLKKRMHKRTLVSLASPCGTPDLCVKECNYTVPDLDFGAIGVIESRVSA